MALTLRWGVGKIDRVHTTPTPQQFRRRRIAAAGILILLIVAAVATGVSVQKMTGWSADEWEQQTAVEKPTETPRDQEVVPRLDEDEQPQITPVARKAHGQRKLNGAPKPGYTGRVAIRTGGETRTAYVQVPKSAASGQPTPLVLAFHGYEESPQSMASYSGLGAAWGKDGGDGAIVVYPAGKGGAWEGAPYAETSRGQDVRFITTLMDALSASYSVDATRVYAAGMSNGGGFALKLACEMPQQFAAVASVAGAYYPGTWLHCATKKSNGNNPNSVTFTKSRTVPFLEIHGRRDETIEYGGGTRHGAPYLAAMRLSSLYAGRAGCFGAPMSTAVTSKVKRVEWPGCQNNSEVMHIAIDDAEHTWPGETDGSSGAGEVRHGGSQDSHNRRDRTNQTITATDEVLAFFERHRRVVG